MDNVLTGTVEEGRGVEANGLWGGWDDVKKVISYSSLPWQC